jgi:hypothetical protein
MFNLIIAPSRSTEQSISHCCQPFSIIIESFSEEFNFFARQFSPVTFLMLMSMARMLKTPGFLEGQPRHYCPVNKLLLSNQLYGLKFSNFQSIQIRILFQCPYRISDKGGISPPPQFSTRVWIESGSWGGL